MSEEELDRSEPEPSEEDQEALRDYLRRLARREGRELDSLCARHPGLAEAARSIRQVWEGAAPDAADELSTTVSIQLRDPAAARAAGEPASQETPSADRPSRPASFFRSQHRERQVPAQGLAPGLVVGDFRLGSVLGTGGMGQVWEAEQLSLGGRKVAVKFVRPDRFSAQRPDYFAREARAGGRLRHPGIVTVHAFGESGGLQWIAMERVEGNWSLRDFIDEMARQDEVPDGYDRNVARFVAEMADALQAAHDAGVIHRDLKPQNVLITPEDRPKVTDFGLARITDETAISQTGELAGTYFYMSPEQVAARRMGIDHRTDVFSLGVVLYEMLALRRPFQGDTGHQIAAQIVTKEPPDPRTIRSRVPRDLVVIAGKALEKDRDRRYGSMAELAADLRRHLGNEPILARPPGPWGRAVKWVRRNPTQGIASLGGVVATIGLVVISLLLARDLRSQRVLAARGLDLGRLSALQDLEEQIAAAEDPEVMWPPFPDKIPAYQDWMARARELVTALPVHREKRSELRTLALRRTAEQRAADRQAHPEYAELLRLQGELDSRRRALAQRRDGELTELPEVDDDAHPRDPERLRGQAWVLVKPDRLSIGYEPLGAALAQRALELAGDGAPPRFRATLARAYFVLGRDEDALEAAYQALDEAPEASRPQYEERLGALESAVAEACSDEGLARAAASIAELEQRIAELDARVDERRTWTFPEEHAQTKWWEDQLTKLIDQLESLRSELLAEEAMVEGRGWSIARRLGFARELDASFSEDGQYGRAWNAAIPEIREAHPELELSPQMGLAPLGPDPDSGLWEFACLQSGAVPERDDGGRLVLTEETGLVFVLLPGGRFWMGAQARDPAGRNFDRQADDIEGPVHEVTLSPFFLSKYEITQGQWKRIAGINPTGFPPGTVFAGRRTTWLHPIENVSWDECVALCARLGCSLPSEAQWEYGARAGTDTVFWTGDDPQSLAGCANLSDSFGRDVPSRRGWDFEAWLDDGYYLHSPIGTYRANAFGLHDVIGNVWEWCRDGYDPIYYTYSTVKDPVNGTHHRMRSLRGGGFNRVPETARSAIRFSAAPGHHGDAIGLRPARAVEAPGTGFREE